MMTTATIKINNLPSNYTKYTYFVCRAVNGEVWFYGAWYAHQLKGAARQAGELLDGFVVKLAD